MDDLELQLRDDCLRMRVRVKPRAAISRVLGVRGALLEVAVTAAPVEGQANAELVRTLARHFGVSRSRVRIVSGEAGRTKLVSLGGITVEHFRARLNQ